MKEIIVEKRQLRFKFCNAFEREFPNKARRIIQASSLRTAAVLPQVTQAV